MKSKKTVLAFGTFDGLHKGHLDFFRQAKALGDTLVVVVARDATVHEVKGAAATEEETRRLASVESAEYVDRAILGYLNDKYRVIEEVNPDIIALGYDQTHFVSALERELKQRGLTPDLVRLQPFHPDKYKSSLLRKAQ